MPMKVVSCGGRTNDEGTSGDSNISQQEIKELIALEGNTGRIPGNSQSAGDCHVAQTATTDQPQLSKRMLSKLLKNLGNTKSISAPNSQVAYNPGKSLAFSFFNYPYT